MNATDLRWRNYAAFARALVASAGPGRSWATALAVAAGALLEGVGLLLLLPLVAVVLDRTGAAGSRLTAFLDALGVTNAAAQLWLLLGVFLAVVVLRGAVLYWRDTLLAQLQADFAADQRAALIDALARTRWAEVVRVDHAAILNLLGAEVLRVATASFMLVKIGASAAMLVVQAALALYVAPSLAATALAVGALVALPLHRTALRSHRAGRALHRASAELSQSAAGFLGGLKPAMAQGEQQRFVAGFERVQRDLQAQQQHFVRLQGRMGMVTSIGLAFAGACAIGLSVTLFATPPALLVATIVIFVRLSGPLLTIERSLPHLAFNLPAYEGIRAMVLHLTPREVAPGVPPLPWGDIELRSVDYRHGDEPGLRGADLRIAEGEMLGISGPSGGGKTTLVDLVVALLQPERGTIAIADRLLDAAAAAGYRPGIAYAAQEPFLLHDTLRWNLGWGESIAEDRLWDALECVGAAELVRRLPHGLDTRVGERGALLSGGERQRIVIARCLLRRPRLLVLDEATSSLDLASERSVLDSCRALEPRPTILVVSHRRETLRLCDRVVTVANGAIRPAELDIGGLHAA